MEQYLLYTEGMMDGKLTKQLVPDIVSVVWRLREVVILQVLANLLQVHVTKHLSLKDNECRKERGSSKLLTH